MDDDELTPDEFRSKMAAGEPATIEPGPRPTLFQQPVTGYRVEFGAGGGVSAQREVAHWEPAAVAVPAR